jgi:signal peptidase I
MRSSTIIVTALCVVLAAAEVMIYVTNPFNVTSTSILSRFTGVEVFGVPATSMEPTIAQGTLAIVLNWPYLVGDPRVGDISVFRIPASPNDTYLKRVVAAAGDRISMHMCEVTRNGSKLQEGYIYVDPRRLTRDPSLCEVPEQVVPAGSYYVLGDNRTNSADSRFLGPIPRSAFVGRFWHGGSVAP